MKKITFSFLLSVLLLFPLSLFSRDKPKPSGKKLKPNDLYFQGGMLFEKSIDPSIGDFRMLAPQSALLAGDLSGYNSYSGYMYNGQGNSNMGMYGSGDFGGEILNSPMFSIMMGLGKDPKGATGKSAPQFRIGVSYLPRTGFGMSMYKTDRKTYDKFTSSQTGQTVFLDSVTSRHVNMNYAAQQLRLDGSVIYRTNRDKRISLYAGFGFTAGLSFNARTDVYSGVSHRTETRFSYEETDDFEPYMSDENTVHETFRNKNSLGFSVYVPVGIDLRLGRKSDLLKHLHFFAEVRPGINITSIPELRTLISGSSQNGLGLRYSMH